LASGLRLRLHRAQTTDKHNCLMREGARKGDYVSLGGEKGQMKGGQVAGLY